MVTTWYFKPALGKWRRYIPSFFFLILNSSVDVDVCKYCLEQHEHVLHPLNVTHAQTLDHAFDALIQVQLWDQACEYAEKLIPCFR